MISHKKTWLFTNNHTVSELSLNPHTIKVHSSTCMFVCTQVWAHSNTHTHTTTTAYRHLCSNWCVLLLGIMKQWQWVSLQTKFLRLASAWIFLLWETWNNNRKFHFWDLGSRWHEVNQVGGASASLTGSKLELVFILISEYLLTLYIYVRHSSKSGYLVGAESDF